jgi:uncharacterized protein (DUF1697 family)
MAMPSPRYYHAVHQYVALLRGINAGGNNVIPMAALRSCFEAEGFRDVATYIQSGNVLFTTSRTNQRVLTRQMKVALSKTFAYRSRVVVRSFELMKAVVNGAPQGFGKRPTAYWLTFIHAFVLQSHLSG